MNKTPQQKNDQAPTAYNKRMRWLVAAIAVVVYIIGVTQDPQGFVESVSRIPTAFSTMVTWLGFTFLIGWWLIDMAAKWLIGKSLRELIQDKDKHFEQNLVVALVIAIPLLMLVSK